MFTQTYSGKRPIWRQKNTIPFNELLLSWNGHRPAKPWRFFVSLSKGEWLPICEWSEKGQRSLSSGIDIVSSSQFCTEFAIKVEGDNLDQLHTLHACVSNLSLYPLPTSEEHLPPVLIKDFPLRSQMLLNHPRKGDLCSPTSTSLALSFLLKKPIDPIQFAARSFDEAANLYGNWMLNVAESYHQSQIPCKVERLPDFQSLHAHLQKNRPVVVSVQGEIPGAARGYPRGHLLCVIGYSKGNVHCVDPAFPTDELSAVCYRLEDLLKAWGRRYGLAYTFSETN